jgi:hypothetical protein
VCDPPDGGGDNFRMFRSGGSARLSAVGCGLASCLARLHLGELTKTDIQSSQFLVALDDSLAVYWCPSDLPPRRNVDVPILLVGITPGFKQTRFAVEMARDALLANPRLSYAEICCRANRLSAFAGMRLQIGEWLDRLHIDEWLGVTSSSQIFTNLSRTRGRDVGGALSGFHKWRRLFRAQRRLAY